jgi:hypothetical protein
MVRVISCNPSVAHCTTDGYSTVLDYSIMGGKQLKTDSITQADIEEYLADYADFSFELRVLKELTDLKLKCQHGGTYDDPITGKGREFDIRALMYGDEALRIALSVECKNIRPNFPLVLHCLKRKEEESYNELIVTHAVSDDSPMYAEGATSVRLKNQTLYFKDQYVAKTADQVGRARDNTIVATDGGVFEKISQAVNASKDLISDASSLEPTNESRYTLVCPVLIVPDSMLWQVKYSDDGARVGPPEPVNHVSYFIGREWYVGPLTFSYSLSHLEILTFSEIKKFVSQYLLSYLERCFKTLQRRALS